MARDRINLHLLRHAHAGDPDGWTGDDAARPLSKKGRRQSEQLGAHLVAIGFQTDAIVSSPKLRARETAEIIAAALGVEVRLEDRLAGGVGLEDLEGLLNAAGNPDRPVLVGHDPDFSTLLVDLSGGGRLGLPKAGMACLQLARPVEYGQATLRWLLTPEVVPGSD